MFALVVVFVCLLAGTGARWRVYGSHAGLWRLGVVAGGVVRSKAGGCTAPGGCGTKQGLGFLNFGLGIGPIGPSGFWVRH